MANKKVVATIAAVATSAALLMGGTMAWQSISQTALNEASEVVNPGGRLHDDFNGENKDVYVENFADEDIFARIKLEEHFEIQISDGATEVVTFQRDEEGNKTATVSPFNEEGEEPTYVTHLYQGPNDTEPYWVWNWGGKTQYLPTFNMNKDSLTADINGTLQGLDGYYPWDELDDDEKYSDYVDYINDYKVDDEVLGDERYDNDSNDIEEMTTNEEGEEVPDDETVRIEEDKTHRIAETLSGTVMSMEDWIAVGSPIGPFWVYDADGWAYWAAPIEPGTATGLLLDGISMRTVMDDGWYYAINAVGQFITKDDLGKGTNTGFYDPNGGPEPSPEALALLETIGVDTSSVVSAVLPETEDGSAPTAEQLKQAQEAAAANLQKALDAGGEIKVEGTVISDAAAPLANFDAGFLWTSGGTLTGGELITTNPDAYAGIFVNAETNWPEAGDTSAPAELKDITVDSNADFAVYIQAVNSDIALDGVTVKAENGGVYAEYGSGTVTLKDVSVLSRGNHDTLWKNSAVAAANNANMVIESGTYTGGKYSLYVFSSGGSITINDGYFNGDICLDGDTDGSGSAQLTINGGYFNMHKFEFRNKPNAVIINGGTFTIDPSTYTSGQVFIAEGFESHDNGDGTWTVQKKA